TACGSSATGHSPPGVRVNLTPLGVYVASITSDQANNALTETVSALSPNNGATRWNSHMETSALLGHWGTPVISDGIVYATSTQVIDQSHATGFLVAISAQDGSVLWTRDIGVVASDPIIQDSFLYISAVTPADPNNASSQSTRSVFAFNKQ